LTLILATGGLGFIGSHTCISLVENGFNILIVDSLINSSIKTLGMIEKIIKSTSINKKGSISFKKIDLRNIESLENIFEEFKKKDNPISAVIHFAGLKSVEESINKPILYWDTNVNITLNLLSVMQKYDCKTIVFSSSATIYKSNTNKKLTEICPLEPINTYGKTKLTIEKILEDIFKQDSKSWKIANLRYFNPIGAHYSGLIGENPKTNNSNLFPVILKVIDKTIDKLPIFGNDWPTKDGTCIRDYIHIMDLADAHYATLNFLIKSSPQFVNFNIGTGKGTSVLEVIHKFTKVNKINIPYEFVNRRRGDCAYLVAENKKAITKLNWKPKKTLENMCEDLWKWRTNNNFFER